MINSVFIVDWDGVIVDKTNQDSDVLHTNNLFRNFRKRVSFPSLNQKSVLSMGSRNHGEDQRGFHFNFFRF